MADIHIISDFQDGDHHVTNIYKVSGAQEHALENMNPRLEGKDLNTWLSAQGAKLDDAYGKPASVTRYDDGRDITTNYKNGKPGDAVTDQHVTATYRDGDHTVTNTYKVSDAVASELAQAKPQPTGQDLDKWLVAKGGKLDDVGNTPAVQTKFDNGNSSEASYRDGTYTGNSGQTFAQQPPTAAQSFNGAAARPADPAKPSVDADATAKGNLLLAFLTGGASLFMMPLEGNGSKFANTTQPPTPAATTGAAPAPAAPKVAKAAPLAPAPKNI